jgi:protein gp37
MSDKTAISWTDHTFNPWWGCCKVSPGCEHCYALAFSKRVGWDLWGPPATTARRTFGAKHWAEPLKWSRGAEQEGHRRRVFCASMADVFEDALQVVDERVKLWALIAATPWLDWQLLTKRPENIRAMVPAEWLADWPSHVWIGTTIEDQQRANERIPHLLAVPATVRFLSCEPLLGPVDLNAMSRTVGAALEEITEADDMLGPPLGGVNGIDWVIIGGESGPKHRPMDLAWAQQIRDDCAAAGVAVWFKQAGGLYPGRGEAALGQVYHEFPAGAEVLV